MRHNLKGILGVLGILMIFNGGFMLLPLPFALYHNEAWKPLVISSIISLLVGATLRLLTGNRTPELARRDGYLIVTLGWLALTFTGTLPYLLTDSIPDFTDAFFETMSGYTTTGATILNDIESLPKSVLFWRSLTQWIGGMGIIVLAVAILPMLGIGGMQLFIAEAPGISPDKFKPRIQDAAKRLWLIYVILTGSEFVLLAINGMGLFDALNHSLTTAATGGFSTRNDSIGAFDSPAIHYIITLFMFLGGTSFTLMYFVFKGRFEKVRTNEEFRMYALFLAVMTLLVTVSIGSMSEGTESAFRVGLFQVVSIVTTTGYTTADYTSWSPLVTILFFTLFFVGGSAGSTAGGVKIVRHMVLLKNSFLEMKRQFHPSAVIPVRLNGRAMSQDVTFHVLAFMILYLAVYSIGSILLSATGVDFETALGASAAAIGNVGPGIGGVGPSGTFAEIPQIGKWLLSFLMLVGRLEIFTVLMILTLAFWRNQ